MYTQTHNESIQTHKRIIIDTQNINTTKKTKNQKHTQIPSQPHTNKQKHKHTHTYTLTKKRKKHTQRQKLTTKNT